MGTTQKQFNVGGMSCSFCAESIEKAYDRTGGVEDVDVSLAHEEVLVQYNDDRISEVEVKDTLRDLGYTIRDPDKEKRYEEQQAELAEGKRRLVLAGSASVIVAALMGWMIFGVGSFESESLAMDLVTLALALGTMLAPGRYIKEKAFQSFQRGIFNQHVLLEAGAFAGLLGGFLGMFVFPRFPTVHFFAVSVFITTYHILSEYTSLVVRTRASQAVQSLLDLQPDTARRVTDGEARSASERASGERSDPRDDGGIEEVPVDDLEVGDRVRVKPGENIPVDGKVIEGESTVDRSVATGESIPEGKAEGDDVIGGSVNETGTLLVEVTATDEDAFLNQVAREIEEARAMKPGIIQLADRVLKYFVPAVLTIAALAFAFWLVAPLAWGRDPNVQRGAFAALAVLVLGYPCALGMATPLALIRGGGKAANRGILMRSGDAFQIFPDVDHIVLDKTGTITVGEPTVSEVVGLDSETKRASGELSSAELRSAESRAAKPRDDGEQSDPRDDEKSGVLATAASAESFSEHPLADAILECADERGVEYADPETFDSVTGKGVRATIDGDDVSVGKPDWLADEGVNLSEAGDDIERLQHRGLTVSGVVRDGDLIGLIGIGDEIKDDAAATVRRMTDAGITPVIITGDNERTAHAVADQVDINRVMADVLPDEKREEIGRLQDESHRVAMVGDGINDAPALTQADIGIAISAGTDIAIESADIVLMGDRLGGVMDAYEIGQESYRKTRQNLVAAFSFNGIGVTVATTGLVHPVFAMIAMVLSVSVVLANSFAGQLLSGERVNTEFTVEKGDGGGAGRGPATPD
ncbi:heavy metal translocating P-type ATPase [Saliphagus infecundisoli]|uniref:Heavy metal translocating P-type ATPase n=1 Tax=Saliphagus infecundisoli TaxID=1849069 RepID=A0ABD5QHV1_9EURY|nr:cation-translocating P-type ATPase [Saliphagus infecundisoli]